MVNKMLWNLNKFSNNTAAIDENGQCYSYGELEEQSQQLYKSISKRSLVFNLCSNEIGSLLGYVSFVNNSIVPLLLDANLNEQLLFTLIETYKPDYIWLPNSKATKFTYEVVSEIYDYKLLKTPFSNEFEMHEDLALLLTTSGSTGSPKLVRQSYDNIRSNTEAIVKYLELDETERPITTLPMSYTYGLSIINTHLYVGASIILTEKTLMQKEFWQQFKTSEATSFGGVPYVYEILDKLRFFRMDLPSLRTMTQAGGKLSPELHKKFAEYAMSNSKKFVVMYGQTEATARMSYLPWEKALEKYGSMGVAIPGGEFALIDVNGNIINKCDTVGELLYKGKNVTLGYAECGEDLSKSDERNGVLQTGDMAKIDEDGYYYIVGRKKRFIKIFGNRVNLDETERLLKKNYQELDIACAGKDDQMHVFIDKDWDMNEIKTFLSSTTGLNGVAFKVISVDSIPRNDSGKILYSKLQTISENI